MLLRIFVTLSLSLFVVTQLAAQNNPDTLLLWPEGAPDALGSASHDQPTLIRYLAPKETATGAKSGWRSGGC